MDVSTILSSLNEAQREAVAAPQGHYRVIAGAGSGKTRVLVHRIAWLIEAEQISPFGILAVTFTNKAAAEMRGRIESLIGHPANGMWIGTFHGLCHRLLRAHWQEARLNEAFQVIDSDDQIRLIKRILKDLNIDDKRWTPRQAQSFINGKKDQGLRYNDIPDTGEPYLTTMLGIYRTYEETCERAGLVDFAELLLRGYELFQFNEEVRVHYGSRFRHILVDEFQDTNTIQYKWLKALSAPDNYFFIVGDDDQSIYGWRGARIENIQQFSKDFANTSTIRLEQNYRSTATILAAANAVIDHNEQRLGKELWTEKGEGEPILMYDAFNDIDEARFIVNRIQDKRMNGHRLDENAILYRSNAQSRILEDVLIQNGIPYRIYGGLRFFERAEIRDALAYLRLVANRDNDAAFERVVNTPTRGIGDKTVETIRQQARQLGQSLWQTAVQLVDNKELSARANTALEAFLVLINQMEKEIVELPLHKLTDQVIQVSGLIPHYQKEPGEKGRARIENLAELVSATRQFDHNFEQEETTPLKAFLAHAALEAGEGQADAFEDCVHLMTIHAAKGLEYPYVYLCGLEEGLFPHQMSSQDPRRLQEERRLCYVGITRAQKQLMCSYAEKRRLKGNEVYQPPSRFIKEIPKELIEEVRVKTQVTYPSRTRHQGFTRSTKEPSQFTLGQRVHHAKFGDGTVLNYEGSGTQARVQVNFDGVGTKWLIASMAKLEKA